MSARGAAELELSASPESVRLAAPWLARTAADLGIPPSQIARLDRCFDEVLANILAHGGPGARAMPIRARIGIGGNGAWREAVLEVSDAGAPFDPLQVTDRPSLTTLAEADLGGLGLLLLRSHSDALSYRREAGCNRMAVTVRWQEPAA
ncbi:MAG TPA: ATP-binding protein [Rhodocyclaceae bacterium]